MWWVDDGIFRGMAAESARFARELNATFPGITHHPCNYYLGHHVTLQRDGTVAMSAAQAIRDLCAKHNIVTTKECPLPTGCVPAKLEGEPDPALTEKMQQVVGSL